MQSVFVLEQVLNGLLVGAYYLLIALGLSLIFALGGIVRSRAWRILCDRRLLRRDLDQSHRFLWCPCRFTSDRPAASVSSLNVCCTVTSSDQISSCLPLDKAMVIKQHCTVVWVRTTYSFGFHEPSRNSVNATSTLLRSAPLIAGQCFSHRTRVFHE